MVQNIILKKLLKILVDVCFRKTEKIQVDISILDKVKSKSNFESSRISINSTVSEKFKTSSEKLLNFSLLVLI